MTPVHTAQVLPHDDFNLDWSSILSFGKGLRIFSQSSAADLFQKEDWQGDRCLIEANHYMLRYEVATDITFLVGENQDKVRAHKYILVARSALLSDTLTGHMEDTSIGINVPDVDVATFRDVLTYLYTDYVDLHAGNVTSLLFAARKFAVKDLTARCFRFLDSEINVNNVCQIMEQAHLYKEEPLKQKCLKLIHDSGIKVLKSKGFTTLCYDCLGDILKSDDLKADEEDIFEAVIAWSDEECRRQKLRPIDENRRKVLKSLVYAIRFTTMDVAYFTHDVSFREILANDEYVAIYQYFHGELKCLPRKFNTKERNRVKSKRVRPRPSQQNVSGSNNVRTLQTSPAVHEPIMTSNTTNVNPGKGNRVRFAVDDRRDLKSPIILSAPPSPNMSKVTRFRTYDGLWKQNGLPDAISFTCSSPIVLYGIEVFGSSQSQETYRVTLCLYDDIQDEVRNNEALITTDCIRKTYEVMFARPIRIPPRRTFTLVVTIKGSPTLKGVEGTRIHVMAGVTFEFKDCNRSSNGTDVTVGQIPSLLFNNTE